MLAVVGLLGAGLGGALAGESALRLQSPAFGDGGAIPTRFACDGADVSPPLRWSGTPAGTRSLALIVDDPDAPGRVWVHWVVFNLPATVGGLAGEVSGALPGAAREGRNSWGDAAYGGPCPPSGSHRYRFTLYALDTALDLEAPDKAALLAAMRGHVLDRVRLVGRYAK
ncbi:MAG TPA: YbhB/YbcL family Raf kinase inhibitor-like protein [Gammaproteobacteria bacterium]|nr:YbhB/YbcL family Raf kinase inhibitor-like protein [Gammaproteobacteria bacterium]